MTTPSNTWTRERVPSTTRTWTLTVSPGQNSGMSSRRRDFSTMSTLFMVGLPAREVDVTLEVTPVRRRTTTWDDRWVTAPGPERGRT
jgi:hypothetical protein